MAGDKFTNSYDLRDFMRENMKISIENANKLSHEIWNKIEKGLDEKYNRNRDNMTARHKEEVAKLEARIEELSQPDGAFKEHLRRTLMADKDYLADLVKQIAIEHLGLEERDISDYDGPYRSEYYLQWDGNDI
jgi:polyhydroxyalkanoate synthesis regulator phasin